MDEVIFPTNGFATNVRSGTIRPLGDEHKGILGPLVACLQRKNPRAFRLPRAPFGITLKVLGLEQRASMRRLPPLSPSEHPHRIS